MKAHYAIHRFGIFPSGNLCYINLSYQMKMSLNLCLDCVCGGVCVCVLGSHKQKFPKYIPLCYMKV